MVAIIITLHNNNNNNHHQAFIDEFDLMISNQDIIQF